MNFVHTTVPYSSVISSPAISELTPHIFGIGHNSEICDESVVLATTSGTSLGWPNSYPNQYYNSTASSSTAANVAGYSNPVAAITPATSTRPNSYVSSVTTFYESSNEISSQQSVALVSRASFQPSNQNAYYVKQHSSNKSKF